MSKYTLAMLYVLCLCLPAFAAQTPAGVPVKSTGDTSIRQQATDITMQRLKSLIKETREKIVSPEKLGTMLAEAVIKDDAKRVKELLASGADVNFIYKGKSILSYALGNCAQKEKTKALEILLQDPALRPSGESASCCASVLIQKEKEKLFQQMFTKLKFNPNVACKKMDLPIFLAIRHGRLNTLKFLLEHGAAVNVADKKGLYPLYAFILNVGYYGYQKNGQEEEEILELLLKKDPMSAIRQLQADGTTPLMIAAYYGNQRVIDVLWNFAKQRGFDMVTFLDAQNSQGETALFYAVYRNNLQTARNLAKKGANPDVPNRSGWTPITFAKSKGLYELAVYMERSRK